jgi:hypothetical protein
MTHRYRVDRASLRFHTPPDTETPALLADFCDWIEHQPDASLGYFCVEGDRLDDFYVEDGSRAASAFVSFLRCIDGSRVGWWRPDSRPIDRAPVVLLSGEGELCALSRTLAGFLLKVATRRTDVGDLDSEDESFEGTDRLLGWLKGRGVEEPSGSDAELDDDTDALRDWFTRWSAERNEVARSSPARTRFAEVVRPIIGLPPPDEPWKRTSASLALAGDRCLLFGGNVGVWPLPQPRGFEAAARLFRDEDARELPEAGLWWSATLKLDAAGGLCVKRSYLDEPRDLAVADDALRRDAMVMPRSPYWTPEWLARRIGPCGSKAI